MERKWEELEMDCLVNVFEKLEIQDLILGVPFVCKSWYRATLCPPCWKSLNFSKLNFVPRSPFAERFNQEYHVHNYSVMGLIKFALNRGGNSVAELLLPSKCTLETLIHASNQCPCLKILGLPFLLVKQEHWFPIPLNEEEKTQFLGLITIWKDLEYLHIQETQSYTKAILPEISQHCKNFIGIKKTGLINDEEALAIVNFLPTLKHLTVTSAFMPREILEMILEGCRELKELIVKDCCGFEVDEEILKMTFHIKNFEFEDLRLDADDRYWNPGGTYFYPDSLEFSSDVEFSDIEFSDVLDN